jgi:hypothetical protein
MVKGTLCEPSVVVKSPLNKILTHRQEAFVRGIYIGISLSEVYRMTYRTSTMRSKTVWEAASRLSKNPKVVARLDGAEGGKGG